MLIINPPFEGIDVAYTNFTIDPSVETVLETIRGTLIRIPANSIVDQLGKLVNKKVNLKYRAFHSNAEIIASGIPMTYDSAGQSMDFISAGMFELKAECDGKAVNIKSGSKIDVELASFKEGNEFNFYKLDEGNGSWQYEGTDAPVTNERKRKNLKRFLDQFIIKLDIDYSANRELKPFHNLSWVYYGNDPEQDPQNNPWIFKEKWRDIKLSSIDKEKGVYNIHLVSKNRSLDLPVSPYIEGDSVSFLAALDNGILKYNEVVKQRKQEEDRIQLEADITRNFEIAEFGYYNWDTVDKLIASGEFWRTDARFKIGTELKTTAGKVYLFSGDEKKMVVRTTAEWEELAYPKNEKNTFIVVLPNKLYCHLWLN